MSRQLNSNREVPADSEDEDYRNTNDPLQSLTALIKCVKEREQLYFEILGFANKNISSTSSQIDQITLFDRFINSMRKKEFELRISQDAILFCQNNNSTEKNENRGFKRLPSKHNTLGPQSMNHSDQQTRDKQIARLCSRVMEILESSMGKTRNSLFNDNNRLFRQFAKLKQEVSSNFALLGNPSVLNPNNPCYKLPRGGNNGQSSRKFNIYGFTKLVIGYIANKYRREMDKIERYLDRLQNGDNIAFRDMIVRRRADQGSDMSQESTTSASKRISPTHQKIADSKQAIHSSSESPTKRPLRKITKQKHRVLSRRDKEDQRNNSDCSQTDSPTRKTKPQTASKLHKFYNLMQLSKKQFLQDYVYEKNKEQQHKMRLMNSLLQKNKLIKEQISQFVGRTIQYDEKKHSIQKNLQASSDQNAYISRNWFTNASKISLKTSFVISKRKASFQLDKETDKMEHGSAEEPQQTIKDRGKEFSHNPLTKNSKSIITPRRKSLSNQKKSKQIFVVKPPMLFQDQIPKAPVTQTTWMQNPVSFRQKQQTQGHQREKQKKKRHQPIRLKKRNNPCPLENTFLPESFQYNNPRQQV